MKNKRIILTFASIGLIFLSLALATGNAAAISASQAKYNDAVLWQNGTWLKYHVQLYNKESILSGDQLNPKYNPIVEINGTVSYNITGVTSSYANITETISNISISYNYSLDTSPFVGFYNQSATLNGFIDDIIYETHGSDYINDTFLIASNWTSSVPITNNSLFTISDIVNDVKFYFKNNSIEARDPSKEIINKFIVSSNITGLVNGNNYTKRDKLLRFGLFYTPFAFSGQNATFWFNFSRRLSNQLEITSAGNIRIIEGLTNFGLFSPLGQSMSFRENKTYTYNPRQEEKQDKYRWKSVFKVDYPKIQTYEEANFDSETGILIEYKIDPTRWDGQIEAIPFITPWFNATFNRYYSGVKPHELKISLIDISLVLENNTTEEIPGYPIISLMIALGIGLFWILKRKNGVINVNKMEGVTK
ncbi:MAG: hypothetical protein ACTSYS_07155 [Promethearchaeota archaeon]